MTLSDSNPSARDHGPVLLVGVGSVQADDRVGWMVADALQKRNLPGVTICKSSVPPDLLDRMDGCAQLHIVDACDGDELPGHLHRWSCHGGPQAAESQFPSGAFVLRGKGTHDYDVISVLELAGRLGRLPESVTLWGIQGERFEHSESISPTVAFRLPDIIETIARELSDARTIHGAVSADTGGAAASSA